MNVVEMQKERAKLFDAAKKFLDEHTDANGTIAKKDAETFDQIIAQIDELDAKIDREKKQEAIAAQHSTPLQPLPPGILSQPMRDPFSYGFTGGNMKTKAGISGEGYRNEFFNAVRSGFKRVAIDYLREGVLSDGGYLVPVEMNAAIISELTADNVFRQIGRTITTASEHLIPLVTEKPTASWVGEGEEISFSKEQFAQISLGAHKLAVATRVTRELLEDSYYDIQSHLSRQFAEEFARAEENSMLTGNGNGQPKGILPMLEESATGTLQTTGAQITADDLLTLMYSVDRVYRGKAVWLASDATLAEIRRLKTADQAFIWEPSMQESEPPRLFGRPVYTSNFLPAPTGGNVAVLFGDFADYFLIGQRGNMEFQVLHELYAMSGQVAFLMTERLDSVFTNRAAIRGLKVRN